MNLSMLRPLKDPRNISGVEASRIDDERPFARVDLKPKCCWSGGNDSSNPNGRLSFHPIPCGSRDRPPGRKVIDEGRCVGHCTCERQEQRVLDRYKAAYRFSDVLLYV